MFVCVVRSIANCQALRVLNLASNNLVEIDNAICVLSGALEELHLGDNRLRDVNPNISQLVKLENLQLADNIGLMNLPFQLASLPYVSLYHFVLSVCLSPLCLLSVSLSVSLSLGVLCGCIFFRIICLTLHVSLCVFSHPPPHSLCTL